MRTLTIILFVFVASASLKAQPWSLYTEHFPPYSYIEKGEVKGYAVELVRLVFAKAEIDYELHLYPWSRAFRTAQIEPNSMVFSTVRTFPREKLFVWIGPVQQIEIYAWYGAGYGASNKKPRTVVLRDNAILNVLLEKQGALPESLMQVTTIEQAFGMLIRERAEITYAAENMWRQVKKDLSGEELEKINRGEQVMLVPAHMAIHPLSDKRDIERLKMAFELVYGSEVHVNLKAKYGITY